MHPRFLLCFAILYFLHTACDRSTNEITPPFYSYLNSTVPYKPGKGKKPDPALIAPPPYFKKISRKGIKTTPIYTPIIDSTRIDSRPKYVKSESFSSKKTSITPLKYFKPQQSIVKAGWPKWISKEFSYRENEPVAFLDIEHGLYSPNVFSLLEDRIGRIWMGHHDGTLSVWDGKGYHHYTKNEKLLPAGGVLDLLEDQRGNIWILTGNSLSIFDGNHFTHYLPNGSFGAEEFTCLFEDGKGRIWIGTFNGLIVYEKGRFVRFTKEEGLIDNMVKSVIEDSKGHIWVGTSNGLSIWNEKEFRQFTIENGLSENNINCLLKDTNDNIWIGTEMGHINRWDGFGFYHYTTDKGLKGSKIKTLLEDNAGRIWIGTIKGVYVCDQQHFPTILRVKDFGDMNVWSLIEDRAGKIWAGTRGAGVNVLNHYNFKQAAINKYLQGKGINCILADEDNRVWIGTMNGEIHIWDGRGFTYFPEASQLSGGRILSMIENKQGQVWIGTFAGTLIWNGKDFSFINKAGEKSIENVYSLLEDSKGQIWMGAQRIGVFVWDGIGFKFYSNEQGLTNHSVFSAIEDRKGRIWLGTFEGVTVWDQANFTHFTTNEGLNDNRIWSLFEGRDGQIWVGSNGGGVNVWDGEGFYSFTTDIGLSQNIGRSIFQDNNKDMWVGTFLGLNKISNTDRSSSKHIEQFFRPDGMIGLSILDFYQDPENVLWIVTSKGINLIDLNEERNDTIKPSLFIHSLQPFFDFVDWRGLDTISFIDRKSNHHKQQSLYKKVTFDSVYSYTNLPVDPVFPYHINDITFQWSGMHANAPHKLRYSYILGGNNSEWSPLITDHKVRFQNLSPGEYTFKVRAVARNGKWSDTATYSFTISPPLWQTWWAYVLYALATISLLYYIYQFQLKRKLAIAEAKRLQELDAFKTKLYTNITHEFRTPLTVISGMARQVLEDPKDWFREGLTMIDRNSSQLLSLVNQMLDLSKLESGNLPVDLIQSDIVAFINYITESFQSFAKTKNTVIHFKPEAEKFIMDFDPFKMETILVNLLTNAIKFTPNGGNVKIIARPIRHKKDQNVFQISISDTGVGISEDQLPFIFDRFYQADDSSTRKAEGTGIGLALTKELVQLTGGTIEVKSKVGKGSTFSVKLPVTNNAQEKDFYGSVGSSIRSIPTASHLPVLTANDQAIGFDKKKYTTTKPLVLIIEDNEDVLNYLQAFMQEHYSIETATNGKAGIAKAIEFVPDIIISDIMMPLADGYEVCSTLKQDQRTSHIPIIILTAKADQASKLSGLKYGADAYLIKPFDQQELTIRLEKLIEIRNKLKEKYSKVSLTNAIPQKAEDPELKFLKKLEHIILDNLDNENFRVEPDLCKAMTLSRPQLYRKLKALTDQSPSNYIRTIRLRQARQLLENTDLSVSEISTKVGFKYHSYFTRAYQKTFGVTPSSSRD